jgi:hypothetical protein
MSEMIEYPDDEDDDWELVASFDVRNERLASLVHQVWWRLPDRDQYVLGSLLYEISDSEPMSDHTLGAVVPRNVGSLPDGIAAQRVESLIYTVSLTKAVEIESDAAAMFVIAHEFAHVILRHAEMSNLAMDLLDLKTDPTTYTSDDFQALEEWQEDHASLQAWLWGFKDELEAFLDAFPESRRPRWYVEIKRERPSGKERYLVEHQFPNLPEWHSSYYSDDLAEAKRVAAFMTQSVNIQATRVIDQETGKLVNDD